MATWYIDLLAVDASGANISGNPYSLGQMVTLLQENSVNGYYAANGDIFKLKGYVINSSLIADSNLEVTIEAWDLIAYGFWGIDSPLDIDFPKIDMYGGVVHLDAPDRFVIRNFINIYAAVNNPGDAFRLTGFQSLGCTFIFKGSIGRIFSGTGSYSFKDSVIIAEYPFYGDETLGTIVSLNHTTVNLPDGVGPTNFYGGTDIIKGTEVFAEYGWAAPAWSAMPFFGYTVIPSTPMYTLGLFRAPQTITPSYYNYSADPITNSLSEGEHYGYSLDLYGGKREYDDGSTSGRIYPSSGIGCYWFSQEGVEINDKKSTTDEAVFSEGNFSGSFYLKESEINSGVLRNGKFYKEEIDTFWSSIQIPAVGNPYWERFSFMVWVRSLRADGIVTLFSMERTNEVNVVSCTAANTLKIGYSLIITLPISLSLASWKLLTVTTDHSTFFARVYLDKTLVSFSTNYIEFYEPSLSVGSKYKPKFFTSDTTATKYHAGGEFSRARVSFLQNTTEISTIESIYDTEISKLPE